MALARGLSHHRDWFCHFASPSPVMITPPRSKADETSRRFHHAQSSLDRDEKKEDPAPPDDSHLCGMPDPLIARPWPAFVWRVPLRGVVSSTNTGHQRRYNDTLTKSGDEMISTRPSCCWCCAVVTHTSHLLSAGQPGYSEHRARQQCAFRS